MTNGEKILSYVGLVDFLAELTGPFSEVVLHDVSNPAHSLVAIRGAQISGRGVGEPMTDFARRILRQGRKSGKDFITNYLGKAGSGGKFLKASTLFIRDDAGEIIGMIGINTDLSPYWEAQRFLAQICDVRDSINGDNADDSSSDDKLSIREMVWSVIDETLMEKAADPARMTTEQKRDVVMELSERGVFLLKGAIADVAVRLEISEPTLYRYLKEE